MKKIVGIISALVIILVAAFCLLGGCDGFGKGNGDGEGSGQGSGENSLNSVSTVENSKQQSAQNSSDESSTESLTSTESIAAVTVEVTVSGRDYIYLNNKVSLDELVAEFKKLGDDIEIRITSDETATKNTMDDLTDRLDSEGFKKYFKENKE